MRKLFQLILLLLITGHFSNLNANTTKNSPITWTEFNLLSKDKKIAYWKKNSSRNLSEWNWQLRLAWLDLCSETQDSVCSSIIAQGLMDKASLVRTKAIDILSARFEGSEDLQAIELLKLSAMNSPFKSKKMQEDLDKRIIFALKLIGGERAKQTAIEISTKSKTLSSYYASVFKK